MGDYPRMPRNFDYSQPEARAKWIAEAYGLRLENVLADLLRQDLVLQGGLNYVTNRMWGASCLHFKQRFPEKLIDGRDPVEHASHQRLLRNNLEHAKWAAVSWWTWGSLHDS